MSDAHQICIGPEPANLLAMTDHAAPVWLGIRQVGSGSPCFIIAEAGVNHNGDLGRAKQLIAVAAGAGVDAVKFQTFEASALITPTAPKATYQRKSGYPDETQFQMLKRLELGADATSELSSTCAEFGISFLSSPFDERSCDLVTELGVSALKVASGEVTNLPFLKYVGGKGLPVILSTGMSTIDEVRRALDAIRNAAGAPVVLLHCVSAYPAPVAEANLRAITTLRKEFGVPVGFSDHTQEAEVSVAAVALGACLLEKHFTLDRADEGPDHAASLQPDELGQFVNSIRTTEAALGSGEKVQMPSERETTRAARRSIVTLVDVAAGTVLAREHLAFRRPGIGISPAEVDTVSGHVAKVDIRAGTMLTTDLLQ